MDNPDDDGAPPPDGLDDWEPAIPEHDAPDQPLPLVPAEGIVPLGYDRGTFYYLSRSGQQVHAIPTAAHARNSLMAMASVPHYWQRTRHVDAKGRILWDEAIDNLMQQCRAVGIFDPSRIRGRGAWVDDGRSVLHNGDRLIVDGETMPLALPGSRYVYEAAPRLLRSIAPPLATTEAHKLVTICRSLRWDVPLHGTLMAGWLALAGIGGGLIWRPSIWITGGAGTGKTYIQHSIMAPVCGGMALRVQSKTTEAGLRQALGSDARPVIFDEFEAEDAGAAAQKQGVLDLMRQASSDSGGAIIKGSQNQNRPVHYSVRSLFALFGINVSIRHHADETRITVLSLKKPDKSKAAQDAAAFETLQTLVAETVTDAFASGLLARSVKLLPIIRHNAEVFARAVTVHMGSRRLGDQLGAMLAGAYSLHSEREITDAQALKYVTDQDWTNSGSEDGEPDERRLLGHLTQHRVRITRGGNGGTTELNIGRLYEAWLHSDPDAAISQSTADSELRQIGIRPDVGGIYVSTSHPAIRAALTGTPWASGWSRALLRLPGAEAAPKAMRFGFGFVSKATWVPLATLNDLG